MKTAFNQLRYFAVFLMLSAAFAIMAPAATLNAIEASRSMSAAGFRGCTISGASVATPSVLTCTGVHRLADCDPVQVAGVGGTTTVNTTGYAKVTGQSTSTFALYSDAALTVGITGTGAYTSGGTASFGYDISGISGDWTLRFIVEQLTSTKKVMVSVEESADGFVNDIRQLAVFSVLGPTGVAYTNAFSVRGYQVPSARFGVTSTRLRLKVQAIDASATLVSSTQVEY
jgi:hypothetical protein